jgi:nicotinamide-nucleotide amidase
MMRAEIIATGTELLIGGVAETNSLFLSEELLDLGIETAFKTAVADDEKDMEEVLRRALERVDVVLVTGGLGPTVDDVTRKVAAKITRKRLVLNDDALQAIKAALAVRGRQHADASDRQALIPAGARLLRNPVGIAPGFFVLEGGKFLAVLPGVPGEMQAMFRGELRQELAGFAGGKAFLSRKILRTFGLTETKVNEALQDIMKQDNPVVGLSAKETGVDIRIVARGRSSEAVQAAVDRTEAEIRGRLTDAVYGVDHQEMEEVVGALLKQRRLTISLAESCTGGMIGSRITNIAGSSEYFERGVVVYSNASKTELLGVPQDLIERHGAVSREVGAAMAQGIRTAARTDIGLSVTGIAGPGGGTEEKPVGLVYVALASSGGVKVDEHRFSGNRDQVRVKASQTALDMVRRHLIG